MSDPYWEKLWQSEDAGELARYIQGHMKSSPAFLELFRQRHVSSVCDAACGFGAYSAMLSANGFHVGGFDVAGSSVELTKALLKNAGLTFGEYKTCDICDIAFPGEAFDAVVAHAVVDHLTAERAKTALNELLRIVKRDGLVYLSFDPLEDDDLAQPHEVLSDGSFPYSSGDRNGLLFHYYSEEDIGCLLAGFHIVYQNETPRGEREFILQKNGRSLL